MIYRLYIGFINLYSYIGLSFLLGRTSCDDARASLMNIIIGRRTAADLYIMIGAHVS